MDYIFFSKMVREQDIPRMILTLKDIGADGVDLCVRPGYPVNPENCRTELPKAAKAVREAGLSMPMVSAPTNLIDAKSPAAENIFRACHDSGIRDVKVGYWGFKPGDYWKQVDSARRDVEAFAALGTGLGVRTNLHTHSGSYIGLNAASVMDLAKGFNQQDVGVYLDPGHLAMHGEPLPIAFSMVSEYLSLIAVKDSEWIKGEGGKPKKSHFLPPGKGLVDWREMMRILVARDYRGPLSFHSEYESLPVDQLLAQTKTDIAFMRGIEAEARKAPAGQPKPGSNAR